MAQPLTHYLVAKKAIGNQGSELQLKYSNLICLGSFLSDYLISDGIANDKKNPGFNVPLTLSCEKATLIFALMLDYIKKELQFKQPDYDKARAFAYGFFSHFLTDLVFQPFIYSVFGKIWEKYYPNENAYEHHKFEAMIDCYVAQTIQEKDDSEFEFYINRSNFKKESDNKQYDDIFLMLRHCLHYDNPVQPSMIEGETKDGDDLQFVLDYLNDVLDYPVEDAFRDFSDTVKELNAFRILNRIPVSLIKKCVPTEILSSLKTVNGLESNDDSINDNQDFKNLTVKELFDTAVNSMEKIISICETLFLTGAVSSVNCFEHLLRRVAV